MKFLKAALVQVDVSVGALVPNAHKIARLAREAAAQGARLIAFPELALSGYPPEDLVLKRHFMADCHAALALLRRELPREAAVVVGTPIREKGKVFNAAAVFAGGRLLGFYRKMLLPNYGVFDEKRVFEPGAAPVVLELDGLRIGLHLCEDSWDVDAAPCRALRAARVNAVLNLSASPYHRGKLALRQRVLAKAARVVGAPLLYCNLVGGQDELVFDGSSLALDARGRLIARARAFADDTLFVDVQRTARPARAGRGLALPGLETISVKPSLLIPGRAGNSRIEPALDDLAEVYGALQLGLRDYVDKNGFRKVVVAVSGGIDSALVAAIAMDALGPERVVGVTMPSQYSSNETLGDAHLLARNLGLELLEVPIRRLHGEYLQDLAKLWPDHGPDTTEENLQARIRGNIVMALSNKFGWLVLTTGNKSELATGYCTLYGDMAGGFALIKDVPKTLVWELARWRNTSTALGAGRSTPLTASAQGRANPLGEPPGATAAQRDASPYPGEHGPIPASTIDRPPSAELRPDQKDTDSLPPYEVLDAILERYVERDQGLAEITAAGFDAALVQRVIRLVDRNEYKRRQGAPGVKITPKAFGRDRRLPITNLYSEQR